jgi:hypothetical protein
VRRALEQPQPVQRTIRIIVLEQQRSRKREVTLGLVPSMAAQNNRRLKLRFRVE